MIGLRIVFLATCLPALAAAASAEAASPPPVAPPPAASAPAAAISPRAMAIARLLVPLEASTEATMREGRKAYFKAAETDPQLVDVERAYPGITAALWPVLEREVRQSTIDEHPAYVETMAAFFASRLEPAELDAFLAFYSSPTGRRIIDEMYRGMRIDGLMAEIISTGGQSVSESAVRSAMSSESRRLSDSFTESDMPAVQTLLAAIPPAKLARFNADLQSAMVEWINRPTPELDARMDKIVTEWMTRYVREHPRRN